MLRLFCSLGISCTLCITFGFAAVFTWNGSEDTDWFNPNNWDGGIPGAADTAIIQSGTNAPHVHTFETVNLRRLEVQTGATIQLAPNSILNTKFADNSGHIIVGGFLQFSTVFGDAFHNRSGATTEIQNGGKLFFAEVLGICFTNLAGAELKNNGTVDFNTVIETFAGTGIISGNGIFESTTISGTSTFSPGASPGQMTFNGGLVLEASGGYLCEIFSPTSFDKITGNNITLGGTLTVSLEGHSTSVGEIFKIIECEVCSDNFTTLNLPTLPSGQQWHVAYGFTTTSLVVVASGDLIWEGQMDADWTNSSNWKGGSIPGMSDTVLIPPASNPARIESGVQITVGRFEVLPCAEFEVALGGELTTN